MKRVCMNFSTKCNMQCDFCYNFFDNQEFDFNLCIKVIDKCIDLGFEIFSIGGGDPFNCKKIRDIISYLHKKNIIIQIDTNGLELNKNDLYYMDKYVKILALPLDGSNDTMQFNMRNNNKHFKKIINLLDLITSNNFDFKVKINTMVSKINLLDINNLGELLENYKINIWSLYEFWPLENAFYVKDKFNIDGKLLTNIYADMLGKQYRNNMYIEIGRSRDRYQTYFFVTPQGVMYVNDINNTNKYKVLGDIFSEEVVMNYSELIMSTMRKDIRHRYK